MSPPSVAVQLVVAYAAFVLVLAYAFDRLARRTSQRAAAWRTGEFTYHADHDAWQCPQDQWLWPQSFDPAQRVMRYRGTPSVCNACPVKDTCTTSPHGREVTREIDPWPHSEAGRFHRGVACTLAAVACVLPAGMLVATPVSGAAAIDVLVLVAAVIGAAAATVPLARHLWRTPSGFPEHVPHVSPGGPPPPTDVFATRWGSFSVTDVSGSSRLRGSGDRGRDR